MPLTPIHTLVGAAMMGMAANNLLVLNGGVLGISGFAHRAVASLAYSFRKLRSNRPIKTELFSAEETNSDPDHLALLCIAGLLGGGLVLSASRGRLEDELSVQLVDVYVSDLADWRQIVGYAVSGLLIGLGSKLSNGCTSGHMLCGVSRLSPRSLVASGIFFPAAVATHLTLGCLLPFIPDLVPERDPGVPSWLVILLLQLPLLVYRYGAAFVKGFSGERSARRLVAFSTALHFSLGLVLSGMLRPSKILGFMNITPSAIRAGTWDPSLVLVILGGIIPQLLIWQCCLGAYIHRSGSRPKFTETWSVPTVPANWRDGITPRLVIGAAVFGVGWGLGGVCPGPAVVLVGGDWRVDVLSRVGAWMLGFVVGGIFGGWF
ncbi:hypothetical protein FS749_011256 [Ceratobasidium sp. UAMH 11750]|nr:hypothetical protein FS749_011256 [Ceratobasidium sp. UAMH 11750]